MDFNPSDYNCSILYKTTKEAFYRFLEKNAGKYIETQGSVMHCITYLRDGLIIAYTESSSYGAKTVYATIEGDANFESTNFITSIMNKDGR